MSEKNTYERYNEEFMAKGQEVYEIAHRRQGNPNDEDDEEKKKKRRFLIIFFFLFFFLAAAAIVAYLLLSSGSMRQTILANNVDATVKVSSYKTDERGNTETISVNNKEQEILVFNAEDDPNDTIEKTITFQTSSSVSGRDVFQFLYEIENRSSVAEMYISFTKPQSNDNNFKYVIYYTKEGESEVEILSYFAKDGVYYELETNMENGVSGFRTIDSGTAIMMDKSSKMTLRVEVSIIDPYANADCDCDFSINLINANSYNN